MDSSSSSCSSVLSFQSSFSGGSSPEYDPKTAYEALAPLWWDEWEWDSSSESEDEPMTDGEADLQFLVGGSWRRRAMTTSSPGMETSLPMVRRRWRRRRRRTPPPKSTRR